MFLIISNILFIIYLFNNMDFMIIKGYMADILEFIIIFIVLFAIFISFIIFNF